MKPFQRQRRSQPRIQCRFIVDRLGPSVDLGAGGLRFLTANPPIPGQEVRVAFQMPESLETVQCHGRVVHITQSPIDKELCEVGIQFQRMMARHRQAIQDYVSARADQLVEA